ncbi:MAG: hypothetical protein B6242_09195 [Anaerolineaceae bacterium 4572_78]|nr:MAG: hypothetical protein B6242_09195 [Anaerolineaceae bacterium 4572_78]
MSNHSPVQGYAKEHWIDAVCVGETGEQVQIPACLKPIKIKAVCRGSRQMCRVNKYGFPRQFSSQQNRHELEILSIDTRCGWLRIQFLIQNYHPTRSVSGRKSYLRQNGWFLWNGRMSKIKLEDFVNRKRLFDILRIIVSIALIYFIFIIVDRDKLTDIFHNAHRGWIIASLALSLIGVVIRGWRWQILLNVLGVHVPIAELVNIYFIGFLFNNLLPSGLGGDAIRMIELKKYSENISDVVTSVLVDRLIGLFGGLTLALIALAFRWDTVPYEIAVSSVIVFGGIMLVGFLLVNRSLYLALQKISPIKKIAGIPFINNLFESFQTYNLKALWQSFLVSILFNISLIAMNVTIGWSLGIDIALVHYLVFVPIAGMMLILPVSLGGLGVREGTYIMLFEQVGVPQEIGFGIGLLVFALGNLAPGLVGGVIYLWRGSKNFIVHRNLNKEKL